MKAQNWGIDVRVCVFCENPKCSHVVKVQELYIPHNINDSEELIGAAFIDGLKVVRERLLQELCSNCGKEMTSEAPEHT